MGIYDDSKIFIVDEKVESAVKEIKSILGKDAPYSDIPKLPELLERFNQAYMKVLNDMSAPVAAAVEDAKARVFDVLNTKEYKSRFSGRFRQAFEELRKKAEACNNVAILQNIKMEADALKMRLLNEITKKDEEIAAKKAAEGKSTYTAGGESGAKPIIKKTKNISIKTVSLSSSWRIETPQDVDNYVSSLKESILRELDDDTIVNIEL